MGQQKHMTLKRTKLLKQPNSKYRGQGTKRVIKHKPKKNEYSD